jgi:hypothetical protein
MKKKLITMVAAGALVLAACGSDSGGDADDAQEEAADTVIAATQRDGIELDGDCVNDLTSQLSDEDAQAIVDAGADSDAEVSTEGTAIVSQLLGCAGNDQIIDAFIAEMQKSGQEFDEECVRDGLEEIDLAELAASEEAESGTPEEVISAVFDCFELGS